MQKGVRNQVEGRKKAAVRIPRAPSPSFSFSFSFSFSGLAKRYENEKECEYDINCSPKGSQTGEKD